MDGGCARRGPSLAAQPRERRRALGDLDGGTSRARVGIGPGEWVWEVDGGPVAQATARPVVAGMSRIGPVYTPPEHRRHGYGAAVTAAASRWALGAGARCVVLFTDAATPTTNALSPRLGYRYRHDAVMLEFARPS